RVITRDYAPDGNPSASNQSLPDAAPSNPAPSAPAPPSAAPSNQMPRPVAPADASPTVRAATAAVVRREVQPVIPAGIQRRITSPVRIRVYVTIDETGRVT